MTTTTRPVKSTNVRSLRRRAAHLGMQTLALLAPPVALSLAARLFMTPRRYRPRAGELLRLDGARPLTVDRPYGRLEGWCWGPATGPTVLLVHGWSGRASQLGAFAVSLAARGFQVVGFDLGAHGRSAGERANIVSLAEDVLAIGDRLGPLAAVVAHSFGGALTTLALLAGLEAERLVYVAPPLEPKSWLAQLTEAMGFDDALAGTLRGRLEKRVGLSFDQLDGRRLAPAMRRPLLVVHDAADRHVPFVDGATLAAAWPGAQLVRTEGLGHERILTDDEVVETVTTFVSERRPLQPGSGPTATRAGVEP